MTKKRKAKGTAVRAWGIWNKEKFIVSRRTRTDARSSAGFYNVAFGWKCCVRPIRITVLEGKG